MAGGLAHRLYTGQVSYDFVGRRRWWYLGSGLVLLVGIVSLAFRGINPSIDFKGGDQFQFPTNHHSIADVRSAVASAGITEASVVTVGTGADRSFVVETPSQSETKVAGVENALRAKIGVSNISTTTVGATWGSQITSKALEALIVFLVLVLIYLSVRFEPKMALAAFVALIHDLVIAAGIYSLSGFKVSPNTVIALLTILGYSLYDTVVVFDKVRENTTGLAGGSRMTFSEAANLGLNQTLVRSINTSVIALLPVAGLLIIGAGLLGAGSLHDLALALFIGLASGAYSSIFIATPLLCDLKEREAQFQTLARRVANTRARRGELAFADAGTGAVIDDGGLAPEGPGPVARPVTASVNPFRPGGGPARPAQPRRRSRGRAGKRKRR